MSHSPTWLLAGGRKKSLLESIRVVLFDAAGARPALVLLRIDLHGRLWLLAWCRYAALTSLALRCCRLGPMRLLQGEWRPLALVLDEVGDAVLDQSGRLPANWREQR